MDRHSHTTKITPRLLASTGKEDVDQQIEQLLTKWGVENDRDKFRSIIVTVLKFASDKPGRGDVKQFDSALRELCEAERVFSQYPSVKKITIFGSARTKPHTQAYKMTRDFAKLMKDAGYMTITGAGGGIMAAAQEGATREKSFGLNISLPFEQEPNPTIKGDPKLITFKYFFTRKLNFVKNSNAVAIFPGGFGTMDECFEALTLMQTGKGNVIPVVFVDEPGGDFWSSFEYYLHEELLKRHLIGEHDFSLFKVVRDIEAARDEIIHFYKNFHSYRYVYDRCVIRMRNKISKKDLEQIEHDFSDIKSSGSFCVTGALPEESNEPEIADLPRLVFHFDRHGYGRLRQLINRINEF
jgi:uncharacterized protein (TIGR00730 family)